MKTKGQAVGEKLRQRMQDRNKKRADDLVFAIRRGGYGHNISWEDAVKTAHAALDAAEKRGWSRGWDACHKTHSEGI